MDKGFFHVLTIVKAATVSFGDTFKVTVFSRHTPRSGIAESRYK